MANHIMRFKGFTAVVQFDPEISEFFGEVIGLTDVITYYGASVKELKHAFAESVEAHLDFCRRKGGPALV